MNSRSVVIVGAGIAGVATAYWLCVRHGYDNVTLVDRELPLSFTTSKSGENFRDCWPQPLMTAFTTRSIELMDVLYRETGGAFEMNYTGYEFVSESADSARFDWGVSGSPGEVLGLERITSQERLSASRPYLSERIAQVVRIGRAGAIDVQAMGSCLLRGARSAGAQVVKGEVTAIEPAAAGYRLSLADESSIKADQLVLAAGPFAGGVGRDAGCKSGR